MTPADRDDIPPAAPSDPPSGSAPSGASAPARSRRLRGAAALLIALIPIAGVVVAVAQNGGGGSAATATAGALYTPAPVPAAARAPVSRGALVALVTRSTAMRATPGGHAFTHVGRRTPFGSPQAFWVVRRSGGWLGVLSPQAGNGHVGWISAAATRLSRVPWRLEVSLRARRLTVLLGRRTVERYRVAIGAPASPTPTGRFAVTDRLNTGDPTGPYGCCILALTATAPHAIQGWNGGNRIAIHSTPETWTIGEAASHGCVRLTLAEGRWLLSHIPLGTPTLISS